MIDLHPAQNSVEIKCSMRHVSLSDNPCYEALSYCWGDPNRNAQIICNNYQLPITKNLLSALRHLRQRSTLTTIWIDAICINQDDIHERNAQVRLMRYIYYNSQRTLVWLGGESDNSTAAMKLVQKLARTSEKTSNVADKCPSWNHGVDNIPPLYSATRRAFSALLKRPWFFRAWIVQEVAVCKDAHVICGQDMISWNDLRNAISYVLDVGIFFMFPEDATYQILMIAETRQQFTHGIKPRLLSLLLQNRSFLAFDPRDMVFALWALADSADVKSLDVEPDYNLSAEQVYRSLAVSILKTTKDLSLFNAPRVLENSKTTGLPSWVPDWSTSDACVPFGFLGPIGLRSFDASELFMSYQAAGSSTSSPKFNDDKHLLGLEGIKIDRIEAVGDVFHAQYNESGSHMSQLFHQSREIINLLVSWQRVAASHSKKRYITGETRLDAYWQTLCAGYMPEGYQKTRKDFYRWNKFLHPFNLILKIFGHLFPRSEKENWYNLTFFLMFRLGEFLSGVPPSKIPQIGFPPQMICRNYRRIARTGKGYIGLTPRYTQSGDWIAIFKGGKMPLVIRPGGRNWQLIGESYVHGIMKGEVWDEEKCETLWLD